MTDKNTEKIKEWISKTQDALMDAQGNFEYPEQEGAYHILCSLDYYIHSLQEEPVSETNKVVQVRKCLEEVATTINPFINEVIEQFNLKDKSIVAKEIQYRGIGLKGDFGENIHRSDDEVIYILKEDKTVGLIVIRRTEFNNAEITMVKTEERFKNKNMTKQETIQVLQSIEDRAIDFQNMTECDWVAIAAAKRHLTEESVNEELEKVVEEIVDPTVLNAYGVKEIANRLRRTMIEPASEKLEEAAKEWLRPQLDKSYANYGEAKMMELTHFDGYAMLDAIEFGAKWQKTKDESTTEDLGEYINEISKQFPEVSFAKLSRIVVRVAKWQKEQMMAKAIDAHCFGFQDAALFSFRLPADNYLVGSEVKVIVIKKD